MYRCETCGADFEAPMILDGSDPRPDCFLSGFERWAAPTAGANTLTNWTRKGRQNDGCREVHKGN